MSSTHTALVFPISFTKHPNADLLSICKADGYDVVMKTSDWDGKDKFVFIQPDTLVPLDRPEFQFIKEFYKKNTKYYRVTVKKIREVISYGLPLPVPDGFSIGDDCWDYLQLKRYEPETEQEEIMPNKGEAKFNPVVYTCSAPNVYTSKYDVDAYLKYANKCFENGEPVWVSEKLHGENYRCVYFREQMYVGSRENWKAQKPTLKLTEEEIHTRYTPEIAAKLFKAVNSPNQWWAALTQEMINFCKDHPNVVLYGELYGGQKHFPYDASKSQRKFRAFDVYENGVFWDAARSHSTLLQYGVAVVPCIADSEPYDFEKLKEFSTGNSLLSNHIREGCVIKPLVERNHPKIGRVCFKIINPDYYSKS